MNNSHVVNVLGYYSALMLSNWEERQQNCSNYRGLFCLFWINTWWCLTPVKAEKAFMPDHFSETIKAVFIHEFSNKPAAPLVLNSGFDQINWINCSSTTCWEKKTKKICKNENWNVSKQWLMAKWEDYKPEFFGQKGISNQWWLLFLISKKRQN